jgi:hypothetical protein
VQLGETLTQPRQMCNSLKAGKVASLENSYISRSVKSYRKPTLTSDLGKKIEEAEAQIVDLTRLLSEEDIVGILSKDKLKIEQIRELNL